ncbi:MAG: trans-2,3-dihydro-3-hydroxyanthranilate isomerase [Planctomycetota bacterium]|jgi:trans-2,3-dihydro-3-hydroxyanthranilate isomerase
MKYQFYTCDVFTDVRFGGNPLAVLPNAQGLSSRQMQQLAREFNYSETTFVLPAHDEFTRKVRIFTPTQEVPFAGHPNIGTAFTLASIGELGSFDSETDVLFDEIAGPVPITIRKIKSEICCELKAPESLVIGPTVSTDLIASALSLTAKDIVIDTHQPLEASVGLPFIVVELKNRRALESARCHLPALEEIHAKGIAADILIYLRSEDEFDIRARMFAPMDGVPEDPATGSANCALVALLTHCMSIEAGEFSWRIAQGVEMKRPSVLDARTMKQDGVITGVWIAGFCKMVSEGYIEI